MESIECENDGLAQISQRLAGLRHRFSLCDIPSDMYNLGKQDIVKNGLLGDYSLIYSLVQYRPEKVK
ncbi:hypothetical protein [Vibrio sp. VB16]|uniref:hypothetical protein n=1 Tax=Vibrio sp. VB16 TaxID=2785746 RepID=UPI00189ED65E